MQERLIVAQNLTEYRKKANLTQQELAEKLNYTDKAVSKWERGDALPDVLVLKQIADIYGIKVDDLLVEHSEPLKINTSEIKIYSNKKHLLISLLSGGLVWLVATIVVVVVGMIAPEFPIAMYAYVTALPLFFIVLLVFSILWSKLWVTCLIASALLWTACATIQIYLPVSNAWLIYMIGAAAQILVILWFCLMYIVKRRRR